MNECSLPAVMMLMIVGCIACTHIIVFFFRSCSRVISPRVGLSTMPFGEHVLSTATRVIWIGQSTTRQHCNFNNSGELRAVTLASTESRRTDVVRGETSSSSKLCGQVAAPTIMGAQSAQSKTACTHIAEHRTTVSQWDIQSCRHTHTHR